MTYVRVTPDLSQPSLRDDGSVDIQWTYKKGKLDDEIFPSSVDLQLDYKVYDAARVLSAVDKLTLSRATVAEYAGKGALLPVSVVFHFKGGGNDALPPGDATDGKNVAVKPWEPDDDDDPPEVVAPPVPNLRAIRVAAGAMLDGAPSRLVATSWSEGRVDVFRPGGVIRGVGNNGGVAHTWHEHGFHAWETIYGDSPHAYPAVFGLMPDAVTAWGQSRLDLFVCVHEVDHHELLHAWYDGGWGEWENLGAPDVMGGLVSGRVAAASWKKGRIDVVASTGSRVFHNWFERRWNGWEELTQRLGARVGTGPLGMAAPDAGRFDVFAFGNKIAELDANIDKPGLYQFTYRSGAPSPWRPWVEIDVPGLNFEGMDFSTPPRPVPSGVIWGKAGEPLEPKYDVFVKTNDGLVWRLYEADGGTWTYSPVAAPPLGANFAGGFDVASWAEGRFDLFVSGADGAVYHYWSVDSGQSFNGPELIP